MLFTAESNGRIKANGGKLSQTASNKQAEVIVVYDGQTMRTSRFRVVSGLFLTIVHPAYDIKMIINKDSNDIIRSQWIKECITDDVLVPLTKKSVTLA